MVKDSIAIGIILKASLTENVNHKYMYIINIQVFSFAK